MKTAALHAWLLVLLVSVVGCDSGPRTYTVTGTVTCDGKPLPDGGKILFEDEVSGPDGGSIEDGAFRFQAKAGKKQVRILGVRVPNPDGGTPRLLPERYHRKTILTAEVTPEGPNRFEFPLESK